MAVPELMQELRAAMKSASDSEKCSFIDQVLGTTPPDLFDELDQDKDGEITMREVGKAFRGKRKGQLTSILVAI